MPPHDEDINGIQKLLVPVVLATIYAASSGEPVDVTVCSGDEAVKTCGDGIVNLMENQ
jgi:hypothetical protein